MHIKKVRAKRFLSFGDDGMEIDFTKLGQIINILGENHDYGSGHSNGSGKSSCIEAIVYGLYGKLMKNLNHKSAGHIYSKKGSEVEIEVDNLRIVRKRNPESLELFEDGIPIAVGGIPATQEEIVRRLRLNYNGFCNVAMFGQGMPKNFLQSSPEEKRKIAENLLCLEDYARFQEVAKKNKKDLLEAINILSIRHEMISSNRSAASSKIISIRAEQGNWLRGRKAEIESLERRITEIDERLEKINHIDPEIASTKLSEIDSSISLKESKLLIFSEAMKEIVDFLEKNSSELNSSWQNILSLETKEKEILLDTNIANLESKETNLIKSSNVDVLILSQREIDLERKRKELIDRARCLSSGLGDICSYCNGKISKENVNLLIEKIKSEVMTIKTEISSVRDEIKSHKEKQESDVAEVRKEIEVAKNDQKNRLSELRVLLEEARQKQKDLKEKSTKYQSRKSQGQTSIDKLKSEIWSLNVERKKYIPNEDTKEVTSLKSERDIRVERLNKAKCELKDDPFRLLIASAVSEVEGFTSELNSISEETKNKERIVPYYDYWVKGFGDKGVRSFLLEERLPLLNSRMDYWLRVLIDNRLGIEFDRDLNETIRRKPDDSKKFVYESLSGGELNRIDLAISQAFAYVTMASSHACPSLIALDEIALNFDRPGVQAVYKMICELSKDRQVLVITHDTELLEFLRGCDTIVAQMRNGVTRLDIHCGKE